MKNTEILTDMKNTKILTDMKKKRKQVCPLVIFLLLTGLKNHTNTPLYEKYKNLNKKLKRLLYLTILKMVLDSHIYVVLQNLVTFLLLYVIFRCIRVYCICSSFLFSLYPFSIIYLQTRDKVNLQICLKNTKLKSTKNR